MDELEDRVSSYTEGRAPRLWPSLDRIHFYPKRFENFPKILQGYVDRMPPDHPSITTRKTKGGKEVPHLLPWAPPAYTAPPLSKLGRRLLGVDPWPNPAGSEGDKAGGEGGSAVHSGSKRARGGAQSSVEKRLRK